jgi:uncharacterized membrane protein YuzA (DUF378 family)
MYFKMAMVLLIIGGLTLGLLVISRVNIIEKTLGKGSIPTKAIFLLTGIAALAIAFNRDTYLPFLGESVFPCSVLNDQEPPGATRSIQIQVEPGNKVIYWASEPSNGSQIPSYKSAYGQYLNAGITTADDLGIATLKVREPQPYTVPFKGELDPHIHFRICGPTGFIGRIKTYFLADGHIEGFCGSLN